MNIQALTPWSISNSKTVILGFFFVLVASGRMVSGEPPKELEHLWEVDPPLALHWRGRPNLIPLKINLSDFESDSATKRLEATRIAIALSRQSEENRPAILEAIMKKLRQGETNESIRKAMISAAAALLEESSAEELWKLSKSDSESAPLVEHALMRLKHPAALDIWRARIVEPTMGEQGRLLDALEGLASLGQQEDGKLLSAFLARNGISPPLRMAAAKALGSIASDGQLALAESLIASNVENRYLLGALVLRHHTSSESRDFMLRVIEHGEDSSTKIAFETLCKIDREKGREFASTMIAHKDSGIREIAILHLDSFTDTQSIQEQSPALADRVPRLRRLVRSHFFRRSGENQQRQVIDQIVTTALASKQFEAVEQAVVLAVELEDRGRCATLVSLLEHSRPEVNVRAAWGLRVLCEDTELLAKMLHHATYWTERQLNPNLENPIQETDKHRVSYLLESFAIRRYLPSEPLLRVYVPKKGHLMDLPARISGIWAIGKLLENRPDETLRKELEARMIDTQSLDPEDESVRYVSVLSVGRLADRNSLSALEKMSESPGSPIALAQQWALEHIRKIQKEVR